MAETLGAVASGIAITTLAAKLVKLRDCWEQIQDAPADISTLLRQIECFNTLISQIQSGPRMPNFVFDNSCLNQSLALCEEGINELTELVNELDGKIREKGGWRKKLGGAKVVLKKDDLKRAKSRMKSAIQLLTLAYQCHTAAMIQLQPEIIVARVAHHIQTNSPQHIQLNILDQDSTDSTLELVRNDQEETTDSKSQDLVTRQYDAWISSTPWMKLLLGSFEYHSRSRMQKCKLKQEFEAKYRLPCWIAQTALHVRGGQNYLSQWTVNYQVYRIIPEEDSPFFMAIRDGDIATVQKMIGEKSAFVTDREEGRGLTVLHMAVDSGDTEMCKLLLSEGVDPTQPEIYGSTALDYLIENTSYLAFNAQKQPLDVYRLLLNSAAINQIYETEAKVWFSGGTIAMFKYAQNTIYPPYCQRLLAERMMWASHICFHVGGCYNGPKLVDLALGTDGIITSEMATWKDDDGSTMLHNLAFALSNSSDVDEQHVDSDLDSDYQKLLEQLPLSSIGGFGAAKRDCCTTWKPLVQRFLQAGAEIHALDLNSTTPLWNMFQAFLSEYQNDNSGPNTISRFVSTMVFWITTLYDCEIDLQKYGDKEKQLGTFQFYDYDVFYDIQPIWLTYGPHPSDWRFWFNEPTDKYAGDFWELIEAQRVWKPELDHSDEEELEQVIPGAWADDDED